MNQTRKPIVLSGIQPSGSLMIGNYIGAIGSWIKWQNTSDCLFPLVDYHAITVRQDPERFRDRCLEFVMLYLACGVDPEKSTVFIQSHVPEHCQLMWILNCQAAVGELERMTQFKEKSGRGRTAANAGLFDYPVLMAADILLYRTDRVPVGEDQKQHLELARSLARRFNRRYGTVFTVPEPHIPEMGARIMALRDPVAKMSKSDPRPENYIALLDPPETIRAKIRSAVTDPGTRIRYDPIQKPGVSNLMTLFAAVSGRSYEAIEAEYGGIGYSRFKSVLAEQLIDFLCPVQTRFQELSRDRRFVSEILEQGAESARNRARPMIDRVHEAIGCVLRGREVP